MIEFSDEEWVEIERGPFGELIDQLSRVHSDLITKRNESRNVWVGAQYRGMAAVVEKAAFTLYETQKRMLATEEFHQQEMTSMIQSIVAAVTGRVDLLDRKAEEEVEADRQEVARLAGTRKDGES